MDKKAKIKKLLTKKVVVLDGAMGTQLQAEGMSPGACPEKYCFDNPDILFAIHADYVKSGADIIYTSTFGANPFKLSEYKITNTEEINFKLAKVALRAATGKILVAGDIGPCGRFIKPFGGLDFDSAVEGFKQQIRGLKKAGVDMLVIETMLDIQEARAALIAAKEESDLFTMVTMSFEKNGRTLNGTDPITALVTLESLGADAFGCNCSVGPKEMLEIIKQLKPYAAIPLIAKPNAGLPKNVNGKTVFSMQHDEFASFGPQFVKAGANLIGGCCGTTPEYISSLKKKVKAKSPKPKQSLRMSAVSSSRKTIFFDFKSPLFLIGERINPTGKKDLAKALLDNNMQFVRDMAKNQEHLGAKLLDVNVGLADLDQPASIIKVISSLSESTDLPLVIDSSDVNTISQALRFYPGRALLNSISLEKKKLKKLLPLAAKYGAMFIFLPISDKGIAKSLDERKKLIKEIILMASKAGIVKNSIIIDALSLAISSEPQASRLTLDTIEYCREKSLFTSIGLSNVSFGLPQRKWLNACFLAMARAYGLTAVIANPSVPEVVNAIKACDALLGDDEKAFSYISHFSASSQQNTKPKNLTPQARLFSSILEGNRQQVIANVDDVLAQDQSSVRIVDEIMIPAIRKVGEMFENKEYFLPQLIASAETAEKGFNHLKPKLVGLNENGVDNNSIVVIATVEGDIHDIGKNIVGLILRNNGLNVVDLGKDITAAKIVQAAKRKKAKVIALSALMTTTMVKMKDVVSLAKQEGINCVFIVGGAVVTEGFATSIGAHYAKDGVEAVSVIKKLIS